MFIENIDIENIYKYRPSYFNIDVITDTYNRYDSKWNYENLKTNPNLKPDSKNKPTYTSIKSKPKSKEKKQKSKSRKTKDCIKCDESVDTDTTDITDITDITG